MKTGERRLAAIMFTDIVGFTRLSQARESLALELLEEHREVLRPIFDTYRGTEVKTIGDAFLVEFKSALDAILCAVDVQEKVRKRNAGVAESKKLELRIGIHVGDVLHESGDVYGDVVNVASRIEPLAEPGGVCISQQVFDQVRNKTEFKIEKVGQVDLKNVEFPLAVYRIIMFHEDLPEKRYAPRERLAVLPFVNISPDPNDEYFADGLTEELITKLSEIRGLKVIARTSVMSYKKSTRKISEIARELEVGTVIEGSVRKAGNKIRVAVQLIDARNEEHLWASNYDKDLDDIFAIQSDIASKVAGSLSTGIFSGGVHGVTKDIEAYTMYLKAMQLAHEGTEQSLRQAVELFGRVVSKDPSFARAYAGLASAWGRIATGGYEEFTMVAEKAEPAALKALELEPDSAEAHSAMAEVHGLLDRFDEAVMEAEKAVGINPNLAGGYTSLGVMYAHSRGLDASLREFQKAYELDPLSPTVGGFIATVARAGGKLHLAMEVLERMKEIHPRNPRVYVRLAECYMAMEDFAAAQEALDTAEKINPGEPLVKLDRGVLYALMGKRVEALHILDELRNRNEAVRLYGALYIRSALGDLDEAFEALTRQVETHSWPYQIELEPIFERLRKDPRYQEFRDKVGIGLN